MSILLTNEILDVLYREIQNADESVQVISAYCKDNAVKKINEKIPANVNDKKLMVRFRMDDVVKGSTDFSAIEFCLNQGWKVYFRFDLHVKTYIVDNKRGIVGSANVTNKGLGMIKNPNLEMATLVDMDDEDVKKISNLYQQAIPVDSELLAKMKSELESIDVSRLSQSLIWSKNIVDLFNPTIETLFSHELPDSKIIEGYIPFLDISENGDKDYVKNTFRWSTAYLWLLQTLKKHNGESYFGELTAELHDALVTDPKPYRKDVKVLLSNLLSIVEQLNMDEVVIDIPNHSQRVRLAKVRD